MHPDDTLVLPNGAPRPRRRRLFILMAASVATLLLAGAVFVACSTLSGLGEEPELGIEEVLPPGLPEPDPVILQLQPGPDAPPAEPEPIPLDGAEQTGSADGQSPCPGVLADGLVITPNPVKIISGNKGAIDLKNCSLSPLAWSASTVSWVTLAETDGNLPSGAVYRLLFTVTTSALPIGPYAFTISVNDVDVPVSGTKLGGLVAPGAQPTPSPVPTIGGIIAPGISPCATKCITQALLSTLPGRADVSLDVRTNTPADIVVMVDEREPLYSNDDEPYYVDPALKFATESRLSQWTVVLTPLQPDTRYHIVVAARDHLGGVSFQAGTFRTPKVIDQLAGNEPGGCAVSCVNQAVLLPRPGGLTYDIEVGTHVPTRLQVLANGDPAAGTGDEFVTAWAAVLEFEPGTRYEVTLRATDEQGRTVQHTAIVDTPVVESHQNRVLVTFHHIDVHDDGDDTTLNRTGELTFRFEVNGDPFDRVLDTGERKVKAPERVSLDDGDRAPGRSVFVDSAPDLLAIRVQGQERDLHGGLTDFCPAGTPFFDETSGRTVLGDCREIEWNTAALSIDLHQDQSNGVLPACSGFGDGVSGDLCVVIDAIGDDPRFTVFITIDFLD